MVAPNTCNSRDQMVFRNKKTNCFFPTKSCCDEPANPVSGGLCYPIYLILFIVPTKNNQKS